MGRADRERVLRYRIGYPMDTHSDEEILNELNSIRRDKKLICRWIEKHVSDRLKNKILL